MKDDISLKIIARIRTDFPTKFGIPRQSGLIPTLKGKIVFEPEYRNREALRGIEGYSHLWLLWKFSESVTEEWSPTVRPPRLGGNKRVGVFATRSPFRPNPIGLSSVRFLGTEEDGENGTVLIVSGADLLDRTPIYDIKPYIPYTDSHPDALGGFSSEVFDNRLEVDFGECDLSFMPKETRTELKELLSQDPRPGYKKPDDKEYHFEYSGYRIAFRADSLKLKVISVEKI